MALFPRILWLLALLAPCCALAAIPTIIAADVEATRFVDQLNTPALTKGDLASSMLLLNGSSDNYQTILDAHGFGNLDVIKLMALVPMKPGSKLQTLVSHIATLNATNSSTSYYPPILNAQYKIVQPAGILSPLIFNSSRTPGKTSFVTWVTFNSSLLVAQHSLASNPPSYSWTDKYNKYNITFITNMDANNSTSTSFNGTMTSVRTGVTVPFAGTQSSLSTKALDVPEGWSTASYLELGLGIPGGIAGVGLLYWRYRVWIEARKVKLEQAGADAQEIQKVIEDRQRADSLLSNSDAISEKIFRAMEIQAETVSKEQLQKQIKIGDAVNNPNFRSTFDLAVRAGIKRGMATLSESEKTKVLELQGFGTSDAFESGPGKKVQTYAKAHVAAVIASYFETHADPALLAANRKISTWGIFSADTLLKKITQQGADKLMKNEEMKPVIKGLLADGFIVNHIDELDRRAEAKYDAANTESIEYTQSLELRAELAERMAVLKAEAEKLEADKADPLREEQVKKDIQEVRDKMVAEAEKRNKLEAEKTAESKEGFELEKKSNEQKKRLYEVRRKYGTQRWEVGE